ncbi:MAG: class I SAM-dependent methyltransferase family protein [Nocardioidaceae bacterium]
MGSDDSHWTSWHHDYDTPGSSLSRRLVVVQAAIRRALPANLSRPYRVISMCAGQGRDLLDVLAARPDAAMVEARLVELEPANVDSASSRAVEAGLHGVEVVEGDAGMLSAYDGIAPADLVLGCGIFGNIADADVLHTVACLPQLCRPDAVVIWTRSRRHPDLTPTIRRAFVAHGFQEIDFVAPVDAMFSVGAACYHGNSAPLDLTERLFTFTPIDACR